MPWTFLNKTFTESEHREKTFVSKSKTNISHWVKYSGLGWPKRKSVNSAYINVFPPTRSWLPCSSWTRAAQQGLVCLGPFWGLWWCLQSRCRYHYGISNPNCLKQPRSKLLNVQKLITAAYAGQSLEAVVQKSLLSWSTSHPGDAFTH